MRRYTNHQGQVRPERQARRRGMAMLLVIISLMMATVLTTAYLSSRDNSSMIGMNASGGASARAAAITGLDMAAVIMETNTNWRTADPAGMLLTNLPIGGGTVNVQAVDELTMHPPTSSSEYLLVTSTGLVNGVRETATARIFAPRNAGNTVDIDLSEFAVFVSQRMDMANHSTIAKWTESPMSNIGQRLALGTRATSSATMAMTDSAGVIDGSAYVPPGASSSLVSGGANTALQKVALQDVIPMPAAPSVGLPATVLIPLPADATVSGGTSTVNTNARYRNLEIKNSGVRTIQGNLKIVTERNLRINSGGKMIINGNVKIAVFGDLRLDDGAIELTSSSSLTLFVRGQGSPSCDIRDSYIGDVRASNLRDNTGGANYFDSSRIALYSMPPTGTPYEWLVQRNSVVKASVYCPDITRVTIQEQSALYGRIATKSLLMSGDAAIFYDPMLNSRCGYTASDSPVYDSNGMILDGYKNLVSLDASALQIVADLYGKTIKSVLGGGSDVAPATPATETTTTAQSGSTTSRPVHVKYELLTVANDVRDWETGSLSASAAPVATSDNLSASN